MAATSSGPRCSGIGSGSSSTAPSPSASPCIARTVSRPPAGAPIRVRAAGLVASAQNRNRDDEDEPSGADRGVKGWPSGTASPIRGARGARGATPRGAEATPAERLVPTVGPGSTFVGIRGGMAATRRRVRSVAPASCAWISASDRPCAWRRLIGDQLEEVPRPVEGRATAHGTRSVDDADGRVPADDPAVGHLRDPPVGCANVAHGERFRNSSGQLIERPITCHARHHDTVNMTVSTRFGSDRGRRAPRRLSGPDRPPRSTQL